MRHFMNSKHLISVIEVHLFLCTRTAVHEDLRDSSIDILTLVSRTAPHSLRAARCQSLLWLLHGTKRHALVQNVITNS